MNGIKMCILQAGWDEVETYVEVWNRVEHVPNATMLMRKSEWVHGGLESKL